MPDAGRTLRRRGREVGAVRIDVDDELELVALVRRAGLVGADHAVDAGPIGLAEAHRAAAGDAIALEHRADAVGAAHLELLEIAGRQHDRAADEMLAVAAERVLAREVAHRLLDERQEAALDRQIVPVAVERRREQQRAARCRSTPRRAPPRRS